MSDTPPTYIPRFCKYLNAEILFVRTGNGEYSKFVYNFATGKFNTHKCQSCYLAPTESDLFPLYAAWSNTLATYIIFAKNQKNQKIEKYKFNKSTEGFEQVEDPKLIFDSSRIQIQNCPNKNLEFFTVGGNEVDGIIRILRDSKGGHFRKEQYNFLTRKFEFLEPIPVKIMETSEDPKNSENVMSRKRKMMDQVKSESEKPEVPQLESIDGSSRTKLSKKEILEIRIIAAKMGNPTKSDSDNTSTNSGFEGVNESSC